MAVLGLMAVPLAVENHEQDNRALGSEKDDGDDPKDNAVKAVNGVAVGKIEVGNQFTEIKPGEGRMGKEGKAYDRQRKHAPKPLRAVCHAVLPVGFKNEATFKHGMWRPST